MEKKNSQSELVARIKTLADDRGLRMQYLAKCLDADAGFFSECSRGKRKMTAAQIETLADALSTTPAYLLGETDEKEKPTGTVAGGLDKADAEILDIIHHLPPEKYSAAIAMLRGLANT